MRLDSWQASPPPPPPQYNKELQNSLGQPSKRPTLCGWASVFVLSSVLLLLGLARPAQAQTTCSATDTAITGITAVTIDTNTDTTGLVEDCTTLLGLKDALVGAEPGVVSLDWAVGTAMDTWEGITVGGTPPRVAELDLSRRSLTGSIPEELGRLTGLTHLDLSVNRSLGSDVIPAALNQLTELTYLSLHNCAFPNPLPNLSSLTNLEELYLHANNFTGPFPQWLGRLTKLTHLHLYGTKSKDPQGVGLTGRIPDLRNLTSLEQLLIDNNSLTGGIPTWLGNLTSLTRLDLDRNQLTGGIPPALGSLTSLTHLDLSDNDLEGEIPDLSGLTALQYLLLHNNALTGEIPTWLGGLTENLQYLLLHNNALIDEIPTWLGGLTELRYLLLSGNALTGPIPMELGDLADLTHLWLHDTNWTGDWPDDVPQALLDEQTAGNLELLTNRRPVAPADPDGEVEFKEGHLSEHPVPFTDPDGDTLICTATPADADESPLPAWLEIASEPKPCTLSGSARTVGEEIVVKVTATDEDTLPAGAIPCDPDRDEADDEMNPPSLCASTIVTLRVTMGRTDFTNPVLQGATVSGNTVIMTYNEPLLEDGCPDGENLDAA